MRGNRSHARRTASCMPLNSQRAVQKSEKPITPPSVLLSTKPSSSLHERYDRNSLPTFHPIATVMEVADFVEPMLEARRSNMLACDIYFTICITLALYITYQLCGFILNEALFAISHFMPKILTTDFLIFCLACSALFQLLSAPDSILPHRMHQTICEKQLRDISKRQVDGEGRKDASGRNTKSVRCAWDHYQCNTCRSQFSDRNMAISHQRDSGHLGMVCTCSDVFKSVSDLDDHVARRLARWSASTTTMIEGWKNEA
ncbi:hypothetical protein FRC02_008204 [Tulasnella sp. 418]|nr:hypothetical protein FRC02_008204 [Tulasnella sp. 418]